MAKARLIILMVAVISTMGSSAFADGVTPWLPAPSSGVASLSFVTQNATEYYRATKRPTPGPGNDLGQNTLWIGGIYSISDAFAVDLRTGVARSYASAGPTGGRDHYQGVTDSNIGLTWRIVDEMENPSLPTVALRGGAIIAGSYETGAINALGDGANGLELSALAGKYFADRVAMSGEVGYRGRDENVPEDFFLNVSGGVLVHDRVALGINYKLIDAQSGLQIGTPPFTASRFPEVEEDIQFLSGTASVNVTDQMNLALSYGEVIDGRNTAKSKVWSFTTSYAFDTF